MFRCIILFVTYSMLSRKASASTIFVESSSGFPVHLGRPFVVKFGRDPMENDTIYVVLKKNDVVVESSAVNLSKSYKITNGTYMHNISVFGSSSKIEIIFNKTAEKHIIEIYHSSKFAREFPLFRQFVDLRAMPRLTIKAWTEFKYETSQLFVVQCRSSGSISGRYPRLRIPNALVGQISEKEKKTIGDTKLVTARILLENKDDGQLITCFDDGIRKTARIITYEHPTKLEIFPKVQFSVGKGDFLDCKAVGGRSNMSYTWQLTVNGVEFSPDSVFSTSSVANHSRLTLTQAADWAILSLTCVAVSTVNHDQKVLNHTLQLLLRPSEYEKEIDMKLYKLLSFFLKKIDYARTDTEAHRSKTSMTQNLVRDLEKKSDSMKKENQNLWERVKNLGKRITQLNATKKERGSDFVWRIDNFLVNASQWRVSDQFYSHEGGYKLQLRLMARYTISTASFTRIHFGFVAGENDDFLPWPFHGTLRLSFVNRHNGGDVSLKSFQFNDLPMQDEARFKQPRRNGTINWIVYDRYPDWSDSSFASPNSGILRNNSIALRCRVIFI